MALYMSQYSEESKQWFEYTKLEFGFQFSKLQITFCRHFIITSVHKFSSSQYVFMILDCGLELSNISFTSLFRVFTSLFGVFKICKKNLYSPTQWVSCDWSNCMFICDLIGSHTQTRTLKHRRLSPKLQHIHCDRHTDRDSQRHTLRHTHPHTHSYIHTHTSKQTHTHTHTHIHEQREEENNRQRPKSTQIPPAPAHTVVRFW